MTRSNAVVLTLSALWLASEFGIYVSTFSARQAKQHDRQSLNLMIGGTFLSSAIALFSWWHGFGRFPVTHPLLPIAGVMLMFMGLALRWSAILTLRRFFTINVAVAQDHQLITHGPYRFMRHPSYTGTMICLLGIGLSFENWICLLLLVGVPLTALLFRIKVEEAVLTQVFGTDYEAYCRRTSRLLPGVY